MSYRPLNTNFGKMPDPVLESESKIIVASVVSNPHFPTPEPSIGDLNTAISEYSIALSKAAGGDRTAIQIKKQKKTALVNALTTLAFYVELQAKGDVAILASSNIKLKKETTPQTLGAIELHTLTFGLPGQLISKVKVKNGRTYLHEYTEFPFAENSQWISEMCTSSQCMFSGLQSGKTYYCRVTIIGTKGQKITTSIISSIVV
jgi:hypothetical protein